ncbi:MAG TPA: ABC transporter permease [Dehalococcoidia bacterium]|nr:ABC transporter permease [Dehalococcoidia bacterium]
MIEREQVFIEPAVALPGLTGLLGLVNGARRFSRRRPVGAFCAVVIVALLFIAAAAPLVARQDPLITHTVIKLQPPSTAHWFGTDDLGRDVFSRVVYGARVSLGIGFGGMLVSLALGIIIAVVSGYFGGVTDIVIQRMVDAVQAIPGLIVVLTAVTIIKPSPTSLFVILGIQAAFGGSRLIRSQVFAVKNMPFVDASRSMGASHVRIMWRAILPNVMSLAIISGSFNLIGIILAEATLSFLGQGVQPPNPSWGQMLSGSARPFMVRAPWMGLAPGIVLTITLMVFSLFGDTLRDELDPRLRGSKGA